MAITVLDLHRLVLLNAVNVGTPLSQNPGMLMVEYDETTAIKMHECISKTDIVLNVLCMLTKEVGACSRRKQQWLEDRRLLKEEEHAKMHPFQPKTFTCKQYNMVGSKIHIANPKFLSQWAWKQQERMELCRQKRIEMEARYFL